MKSIESVIYEAMNLSSSTPKAKSSEGLDDGCKDSKKVSELAKSNLNELAKAYESAESFNKNSLNTMVHRINRYYGFKINIKESKAAGK